MPKSITSPFGLAFALALSETFLSANAQYYYPRRRTTTGRVIAGIVVGVVAGILLFVLLCMMTRRRRRGLAVMPFGRPGRQQNTPLPTTMNHTQGPYQPHGPYPPPPGAPGVGSNYQQYQPPHGAPGGPDKEVAPQYTEFAPPPGPPPTAPAAAHTTGKDESFVGGFRHS
ncbi:hypothetical protein PC9H_006951 [Pleurotus ostreatus]|uniref:Uncharacterized protein n=1 Tax=Pleurotus ostreatus TaxID=5322 RepID=A0A8H6ZXM9_PLEOS|nr:uncharacterized protein PC9H_006951 [Pleurotus ostreatus]KAF7431230.1 hypothetical protein PC9H_006951 [Pleurotus ostreatus]